MRKRLVGLVGAMVVAIAGTAFAGSTSQQGYVDGMTCVGYLTTTASSVVATTKCVPANSSYIYAKATAYIRMECRKQVRIMWQITQERWKYPQLRLEAIFIMEEVFIQ